jgi:catechol 2,3-dioxygenase-like lactoylglutathione lyase family enzyme
LFSHVFISVSDFDRALKFYDALMACLEIERRFCDASKPWAGWQSAGKTRPLFVICKPHNGAAHDPGNGQMVAFLAHDRETVRRAHATALLHGGSDEGAPGPRPQYHEHYHGAYFRDREGNKLGLVCHSSQP